MKYALIALPLAIGLAACGSKNEPDEGTTISIDATSETGKRSKSRQMANRAMSASRCLASMPISAFPKSFSTIAIRY